MPSFTPGRAVSTWRQRYCAQHHCASRKFVSHIFWQTLHRRALPIAPLLLLCGYFAADRALIARCAEAHTMEEVREEIRDHLTHPFNRGWLREKLALRVSTQRLRRLAHGYLPGASGATYPPFVTTAHIA